MSNLSKVLLIGWVFIFVIVACYPHGEQEQVSDEEGVPKAQVLSEIEPEPSTMPVPSDDPPESQESRSYDELEIVTLLPRDGIPAIDNPEFLSAEEADSEYAPDELVIGVHYDGDARAYSIPFLSGHEIVNDTVGGRKIAVTW
jgi:hypothetical protein